MVCSTIRPSLMIFLIILSPVSSIKRFLLNVRKSQWFFSKTTAFFPLIKTRSIPLRLSVPTATAELFLKAITTVLPTDTSLSWRAFRTGLKAGSSMPRVVIFTSRRYRVLQCPVTDMRRLWLRLKMLMLLFSAWVLTPLSRARRATQETNFPRVTRMISVSPKASAFSLTRS